MEEDVQEALELAAGSRKKVGMFSDHHATPSRSDVAVTRKTILLFLESIDPMMTVGDLRYHLDQ